jgi:pimeloyl-ACP methyl ester carboxylesterase
MFGQKSTPKQRFYAMYTETPEKITYTSKVDGAADWYMLCNAGRGTDCLVYLHGHGSRGDQLFTRADIKNRLPLIAKLNLSVIAPDLRGNSWMCPTVVEDLSDILNTCREKYGFRNYVFVSGSMGGTGALIFAIRHPELADAVGVMGGATKLRRYCDFLRRHGRLSIHKEILDAIEAHYDDRAYELHDVSAQAEKLTMPLYYAHGTADGIMPKTEMFDLRDKLDGRPGKVFRAIPHGGHDSPIPLFGEILESLLTMMKDKR